MRIRFLVLACLVAAILVSRTAGIDDNDPKLIRWRMQRILKEVSETVEKNFYDAKLNGVDWKGSVEIARQRIDKADHTGEMVAAITGLLARLNDSHTVFIPPGRTEHPLFGFDAKPFGDAVLVYDVMAHGPADVAGLRVGDQILAVNDFKANRANIDIMMMYFRFLDPSRTLRLKVSSDGTSVRDLNIDARLQSDFSRDFSHLYSSYVRERKQELEPLSKEYDSGIVYLRLPSFMIPPHDAGAFARKAEKARAVILDLRENGGGRVETLEELTGHFLGEEGKLAESIAREETRTLKINPKKPNIAVPLFVMVDSHSASASEIFSRSIQLNHRGKVVGDRSSGRVNEARIFRGVVGSVYSVFYATEIAVARVVMPDGKGLEGSGVVPDELCVPISNDLRSGKDPCLNKALELARGSNSAINTAPSPTNVK
jgi:carboxyl-terminal processing protease